MAECAHWGWEGRVNPVRGLIVEPSLVGGLRGEGYAGGEQNSKEHNRFGRAAKIHGPILWPGFALRRCEAESVALCQWLGAISLFTAEQPVNRFAYIFLSGF